MALADAIKAGQTLGDIEILSLGTGASAQRMQIIPPPTNYGPLLWLSPIALDPTPAFPLISVLTDGVPAAATFRGCCESGPFAGAKREQCRNIHVAVSGMDSPQIKIPDWTRVWAIPTSLDTSLSARLQPLTAT